jgi:hypothetical protein
VVGEYITFPMMQPINKLLKDKIEVTETTREAEADIEIEKMVTEADTIE